MQLELLVESVFAEIYWMVVVHRDIESKRERERARTLSHQNAKKLAGLLELWVQINLISSCQKFTSDTCEVPTGALPADRPDSDLGPSLATSMIQITSGRRATYSSWRSWVSRSFCYSTLWQASSRWAWISLRRRISCSLSARLKRSLLSDMSPCHQRWYPQEIPLRTRG